MSTSFLNLSQAAMKSSVVSAPFERDEAAPSHVDRQSSKQFLEQESSDFEIVFGRRQIAGTGLLLMVGLVCFSGVSYLIGRSAAAKNQSGPAVAFAAAPAPVAAAAVTAPVAAKASALSAPAVDRSALFSEAISGQVYIQAGAIDKGLAAVWAEGLRTHGLKAFVSSGPSEKMWRVLIGPLPDQQSYMQAKNTLDQLGIETFGRRYNDPPATAPKPALPANIPANGAPASVAPASAPVSVPAN